MKIKVSGAALCLFLGLCSLAGASAIRYDVTNLNVGTVAAALSVNASGHVVGYYYPTGNSTGGTHGFFYKDGAVTDIPTFGGLECRATGINDADIVVGWADYSTTTQAFTFINGVMKNRGTLGGSRSYAQGINNNNQIVGSSKFDMTGSYHAFIYQYVANAMDSSSITNTDDTGKLGGTNSYGNAINILGVGAGSAYITGDQFQHATSYFNHAAIDLGTLGGDSGYALGINDNDVIVGYANTAGNAHSHAFSYDAFGVFTDLGVLDPSDSAANSQANGINNRGQIVGYSQRTGGGRSAFVYADGVLRDLNQMIAPGSGMILWEANGINDSGQIAGMALSTDLAKSYAVLLTPRIVPNPTVAVAGKAKVKTKKAKFTISGTAVGDVTGVTWQLGKNGAQTAAGTASWSFRTKLKHGKNVFTITSHGYGGDSAPVVVTVIRA